MDFKIFTKLTIYSIIINFLAIFGILFFVLTIPTWSEYGYSFLKYDHKLENIIPIDIQIFRGASYLSLILYLTFSFLSIYCIKNIDSKDARKILFFSLGIFVNFFLPYIIYFSLKNGYYRSFLKNINEKGKQENGIYKSKKFYVCSNHFLYKIFTIFCFMVSVTAIIIAIIPMITTDTRFDSNNVRSNFFFGSLSFFTIQINFLTFLFMLSFILFGNRVLFESNKYLIHVASYIFIVMIVFWILIFPKSIDEIMISYPKVFDIIKTTWHHGVNPFVFTIFTIWTLKITKRTPFNLNKLLIDHSLYPLVYGTYIYGLPFFTQTSIYGRITNINPNSISYYDVRYNLSVESGEYIPSSGMWENFFIIIPIAISILFVLFIFWYLTILFSNSKIKEFLK
ncbi:MAG: DUF1600 domain-containing protein [Mycoplasmoidaceae bacterium]